MEELGLAPRDRPRRPLCALRPSSTLGALRTCRLSARRNVRVAMRRAVEARWEKLGDDETPGAAFIGAKQEQIEHNEPLATPLDEILSVDDADACDLRPAVDITGAIRAVRMKVRVAQPAGPEQYRRRISAIESNVWLMMATKYFSRPWLQTLGPGTWGKFVDYVLGNMVHLLNLNADTSTTPLSPPWNIVLAYELRMRKRVFERIREEGVTMVDAVQDVVKDAELRELHFITPFIRWTHSPAARSTSSAPPPGPPGPRDPGRPTKRQRTRGGRPTPQAPAGRSGQASCEGHPQHHSKVLATAAKRCKHSQMAGRFVSSSAEASAREDAVASTSASGRDAIATSPPARRATSLFEAMRDRRLQRCAASPVAPPRTTATLATSSM